MAILIYLDKPTTEEVISMRLNELCKEKVIAFFGSTKYIPIGAEYHLVRIEKIRILLHEDYYPIGKEFPFVGTGQYIFSKTGEEKETLIFSDNDYTFSGTVELSMSKENIEVTIKDNSIMIKKL